MAKAKTADEKIAISYVRFSRPEQLKGDSLRRQLQLSEDWCKRNHYRLDESVKYQDLGVSAFRGKNAAQGKLAAIIKRIGEKRILPGTVLLIESLDRLSRNQVGEALELFLSILRQGITIVTLTPEETFTKESTNDLVKIIIALIIMSRAYEESNTKSKRIIAAWDQKREAAANGRIVTKQCPSWLRLGADGKWEKPDPKAVTTINLMFKLKRQGMGIYAITRRLNAEATWVPKTRLKRGRKEADGFHLSFVKYTLQNPAVIGILQPHTFVDGKRVPKGDPIEDYYPKIVDRKLFFAVQKLFEANRGKGGRNGKVLNLFRGIVNCPYCGGSMTVEKGHQLICYNGKRGFKCLRFKISYAEVEKTILENCRRLRPESVLPNPDEQEAICTNLRERMSGRAAEIAEIEHGLQQAAKRVFKKQLSDALVNLVNVEADRLAAEKTRLEDEQVEDGRELEKASQGLDTIQRWQKNFEGMRRALDSDDPAIRIPTRQRMQLHLRELIAKIEVFAAGHRKTYDDEDRDGDDFAYVIEDQIAEHEPGKRPNKSFRSFLGHVTRRRMSKDGRFIRVQFTSGSTIDMVPEGSIASGLRWSLVKADEPGEKDCMSWWRVGPNFDELWAQYRQVEPNAPERPGLEDRPRIKLRRNPKRKVTRAKPR